MKKALKCILLVVTCCTLLTCKKYDEGGWIRRTCKNLFGGNKVGDSKTWKLKKYEVNGIDSTYLINTGGIPDFYEKFIEFTYAEKGDPSISYNASTFLDNYYGKLSVNGKQLTLANKNNPLTKNDSLQCNSISGNTYCSRSLMYPEINDWNKIWEIKKLTKSELILSASYQLKNNYRIEFESK